MKRGFVFPGQGSQAVGMGRALAEEFGEARAVFAAVDDALDQKELFQRAYRMRQIPHLKRRHERREDES